MGYRHHYDLGACCRLCAAFVYFQIRTRTYSRFCRTIQSVSIISSRASSNVHSFRNFDRIISQFAICQPEKTGVDC